jgi:branched-chain amino acid transport system permease protein
VRVDWPFGDPWLFIVCAALATLIAGVAGLVIGWLISDLDTDGVLLETLGFATLVFIFATTEKELTGGSLGMGGLRFPYDVGTTKQNEFVWLIVITVVVIGIFLYARQVHRSPYGRLLIATGGNEALARSLGKSTYRTKLVVFATTSALMGLLGALFGVMVRFLNINNLGIDLTIAVMVGLILGGSARVWGAVVGTVIAIGLFDIVIQAYIPLPREWYTQSIPVLREAIFGLTLVVVLLVRPLGILGDMQRDKLMRKIHGR